MSEEARRINWYPGHMAKTRRELIAQLQKVDLVLELCDARLPRSSRNPDLEQLAAGKRRILLLNKADLAAEAETSAWLQRFRGEGLTAYALESRVLREKNILHCIDQETRELRERALERGVKKSVRVMVIGIPNVGKSTFINRLRGSGVLETGDRPGVTRSNRWVRITPYLELLDTPGMLWPRLEDQLAARRLCYLGTINDETLDLTDLCLFLLNDLMELCPDRLMERFHFSDSVLRGVPLMDAICQGRGWLLRGGELDYDRCARVVLDEFRGGKLGRVTLEKSNL